MEFPPKITTYKLPNWRLKGTKFPIAIDMAGASWGHHFAKKLVHFKSLGVPITDRAWWEGRYVLCPVRLRAQTEDGEVTVELADAVAAVSRERRVVSTSLVGRDGTVKEYINEGDWSVNLVVGLQSVSDGVIADEWPGDELRELRRVLETKAAVEVQSEFLAVFDITKIVIKSWNVQQMTEANYQAVSISAVSDEDYEIYSNEY